MLELTSWRPHGDSLANLGPKTPNNMGSSCEKNMTIVDFRFSLFRHFGPFGGHWEKMVQLTIVTNIDFVSFDMTSRLQKH